MGYRARAAAFLAAAGLLMLPSSALAGSNLSIDQTLDEPDPVVPGDAQPGVPVLPPVQVAEPADGLERPPAGNDAGRVEDHVAHEEGFEHVDAGAARGVDDALWLQCLVARVGVRAHQRELRVAP